MLPQVGGSEMLLIGIIALIIIGPKDLPKMLRELGRWVGKIRGMANDFRTSFDDMARQSELDSLRREVEAMRLNQPLNEVQAALDASNAQVDAMVNGETDYPVSSEPDPLEFAPPKPKRVRKPKAVVADAPTPAPVKRVRKPKADV